MEPCRGAPRRAGEVVQAASREKSEIEFSTNRHVAADNMDTDNCEARGGSNVPLFFYRGKTAFRGMFWVPPTPPSMENKEHWTQPGCRNPLDFRRLGINTFNVSDDFPL